MRLNKKEEKKNNKVVTQQMVDAVHTGNNLNKRKRKVVCVGSLSLIVIILGIIAYSENIKSLGIIENIKRALEEIVQSSSSDTQDNITTVDVTGIELGKETQHEHIYKTIYDENKHWEECIVCNEKRNENTHTFTTTWNLGYESCDQNNSYTKVCTCGYSETGHKPCVWDGYSYRGLYQARSHLKQCSVCKSDIMYSYYYNGTFYIEGEKQGAVLQEYNQMERCSDSNGKIISCTDTGVCTNCKGNYPEEYKSAHYLAQQENNKIICVVCKKEFGTINIDIKNNSDIPITYTATIDIKFTNGMTFSRDPYLYFGFTSGIFTQETIDITYINDSRTDVILTTTMKFNSTFKSQLNIASVQFYTKLNGSLYESHCQTKYFLLKSDLIEPVISSIKVSGNEWTKSKPITISGTENWTDIVNVKIKNDKEKIIYDGKVNVVNNNWSISCIPDIESGIEGRTFKVVVTDVCENSTEQEFTISKIDGVAPEVISIEKVDNEWAREKNITFIATDQGIGNVQIAFNDVSDYSLAVKNGIEYSKEYKLTGDVYKPREANVYYKDELGNVSTKKVTIDKLDNTAPTITGASFSNNKLNVTAHDRHQTEGEGSGVSKYRFLTSTTKLENPEITEENSTQVAVNENIIIPEFYKVKYVYVVAEDAVGNISEVYEVEVPQLELTSQLNLSSNNGKGAIELDWSSYDSSNKYFVVYRREKDSTDWEKIVGIENKLTGNKYTDNLGNDKEEPTAPSINIAGNTENNSIDITVDTQDNGSNYTYYIESYDNTNTLINISNEIK